MDYSLFSDSDNTIECGKVGENSTFTLQIQVVEVSNNASDESEVGSLNFSYTLGAYFPASNLSEYTVGLMLGWTDTDSVGFTEGPFLVGQAYYLDQNYTYTEPGIYNTSFTFAIQVDGETQPDDGFLKGTRNTTFEISNDSCDFYDTNILDSIAPSIAPSASPIPDDSAAAALGLFNSTLMLVVLVYEIGFMGAFLSE
jgi:hypothetical protein